MPELPEGWEVFHMPLGLFCQSTHIAKMPRAPCLIHGSMSGFGQIWWLLCVPPQPIPLPGCCRSLELGAGSFSGRGTGWALPDTAPGFPETPVPSQPWEQLAGSCSSAHSASSSPSVLVFIHIPLHTQLSTPELELTGLHFPGEFGHLQHLLLSVEGALPELRGAPCVG